MTLIPGFWSKNTPDGFPRVSNPKENASLLPIFAKALATANSVDELTSRQIDLAVLQSDIRNPYGWLSGIGSSLVRNWVKCTHLNRKAEFQTTLSNHLLELNSLYGETFEAKAEQLVELTRCD